MKIVLPLCLLINVNLFCQINPPKPFNYDKELEFKSSQKLKTANVYVYKTKIGFENLDSLSQNDFLEEKTKIIFNNGKAIEYIKESNLTEKIASLRGKETYKLTFDNNNNLIEQTNHSNSYGANKNIYEYNADSTKVTNFYYQDWRDGLKKSEYYSATINFIDKGKITKSIDGDGNVTLIRKYDYRGNTTYDKQYGVETTTKYTYNSKGKIIKEYVRNNAGLKFLTLYKYDNNGNLTQKKHFRNNFKKPKEITTYKYQNNALKNKTTSYFQYGNVTKTSRIYTNDNRGNWIEQKIIKNGILQRVIKRYLNYL